MKPLLRFSFSPWTILVFCALLQNIHSQNEGTTTTIASTTTTAAATSTTTTETTTTTTATTTTTTATTTSTAQPTTNRGPEEVLNLTVSEITTSSVKVSWSPTADSHYRLYWTDGNDVRNKTVNKTIEIITALNSGTLYTINVTAVASHDHKEGKHATKEIYTKPEAVVGLNVTGVTTTSVSLNWNIQPAGESLVFRVKWKTETLNRTETHVTINELNPGEHYCFNVTAVAGGIMESDQSMVCQFTKPEIVRNLSVTEVTTDSISLKWTKPLGSSSFYKVELINGNKTLKSAETELTITNLTAGTKYDINVTAVAADNRTEGASVFVSSYTKPEMVRNLSVTEVATDSISLKWTKPEMVRNLTVTEVTTDSISLKWTKPLGSSSFYKVEWINGNKTLNSTETELTITNLTAGTKYEINVTAVAADYHTEGASVFVFSYTKPEMVRNLTVTEVTTDSISLSWTEPLGSSSFYKVEWIDGNKTLNSAETELTITNLTAGTKYDINVTAVAADNRTQGSIASVSRYTRPVKPENLTTGPIHVNHITIRWTLPKGRVDKYIVDISNGDTGYKKSKETNTTVETFSDLDPGRVFIITVTSVAGDFNNTSDQLPVATYPTPPQEANISKTNSSLMLKWLPPKNMDNAPGISYLITYQASEVDKNEINQSSTEKNIDGLQSGTLYIINLTTIGPEERKSIPVILSAYTLPNPVQNAMARPINTTSIRVTWSHPDGLKDYYLYSVETCESSGNCTDIGNTTNTSYDVFGLEPGSNYNISIRTIVDSDSESSPVEVSSYTMPKAVTNLNASFVNTTFIQLTWTRQTDHKASYSYLVEAFHDSGLVSNYSTPIEAFPFDNLTPGTNYTFKVYTVQEEVKSTPASISDTTIPGMVTDMSAIGTTNSMSVNWIKPHGGVSFYIIELYNEKALVDKAEENETQHPFPNLKPGVIYDVKVITKSGSKESKEAIVSNATFPNPPGTIMVDSKGINFINLTWSLPADMDHAQYNFTVTSLSGSHSTSNNWFELENLASGTIYEVSVVTVGVMGYESTAQTTQNYTKPHAVTDLKAAEITTSLVTLMWNQPESEKNYSYEVQADSVVLPSKMVNITLKKNYTFGNLESARNYSFTVTTLTPDDTRAESVTISKYTRPLSITNLTAKTINTTAIQLRWETPYENRNDLEYLVETTGCGDQNITSKEISLEVTALAHGTRCNFCVSIVAPDGIKGERNCISQYTKPLNITNFKALTLNTTAVHLTWETPYENRPDLEYLVQTTGCGNQTIQSPVVNKTFSNLTPGTECTFCVTIMTPTDIRGDEICTSQYTKPEKAHLTILNEGSNNSLLVVWTKPTGNVEHYELILNSSSTVYPTKWLNSTNTSFLYTNLSAAVLYKAELLSCSGKFCQPSQTVTNATYPTPPGPIEILRTTTNSVEMRWGEAPMMSLESNYSYKLTYNSSQPDIIVSSAKTNYTLSQLLSGTSYNISVKTVGPLGFESESVYRNMVTTKPYNVISLSTITEEKSINVSWKKPDEYKDTYFFFLTWQSSDGTVKNITITDDKYKITELTPGTEYNITVSTRTSDGAQSATEEISNCTNASPVKNLRCERATPGKAEITLNWTKPDGMSSGFQLTISNSSQNRHSSDNCCSHVFANLAHYSNYTLTVESQSCGKPSTPKSIECSTGVGKPPIQKDFLTHVTTSKTHNTFTLRISSQHMDNTMGPVTHVGVIVTSDDKDIQSNLENYLGKTYEQWRSKSTQAYLATVANYNLQTRSSSDLELLVGTDSKWENYHNGLLDPSGTYRYAVVIFTHLVTDSGLIDSTKSVVSITQFSEVVALNKDPVTTGIAIGVTLGIFGFLFIILIGFVIYWRRLSRKESPDIQILTMGGKVSVAVRVEDFEAYYKKQRADSSCGFAEEFEDLRPVGTSQAKVHALDPENKPKNRYNNVLPYDSSRVKLSVVHGSPNEDYINANYMPGYLSRKEYIAAQGPLPATVNEFWRMIWEKNVQTLVMLTRCNEQGRVKCEQYWSPGTKYCEDIIVTTTSEIPLEDWTIRDFDIKNVKTAEVRSVRHFHFTAWPDHGVPETTELLISFRHLVREHMNQYSRNSPTVVHCSAGVGRTGTFIAIDRLIFQIERENIVDVYGIVHDLRMHRPLMVQTEDQYVFLNQCALDIIRARTGNNVDLIYQNTAAISIYENVEPKSGY
ncbi:PREDICTED: receptor-type tyrosine-protein phosphatase eta-like [Cyprinodon variegatus]|uniref:receptor-type tyrosine-protein phosphatase eta-like n=1 Tax=Cyprinodon variegatus TaxID=28743 RepID=UPI00074277EC|nr:PREDICTED: receptor-type tyrosine-protein phosphatase eta-like [Cyprinodon variegatus]